MNGTMRAAVLRGGELKVRELRCGSREGPDAGRLSVAAFAPPTFTSSTTPSRWHRTPAAVNYDSRRYRHGPRDLRRDRRVWPRHGAQMELGTRVSSIPVLILRTWCAFWATAPMPLVVLENISDERDRDVPGSRRSAVELVAVSDAMSVGCTT